MCCNSFGKFHQGKIKFKKIAKPFRLKDNCYILTHMIVKQYFIIAFEIQKV